MRRVLSAALVAASVTVAACVHGPLLTTQGMPSGAQGSAAVAPAKYGDSILHGGLHKVYTDGVTITGTGTQADPLVGASGLSGGTTGDLMSWASASTATNYAGSTCGGSTVATALSAAGVLTCGVTPYTGTSTSGTVPVATGANSLGDSDITDNTTTHAVTIGGVTYAGATAGLVYLANAGVSSVDFAYNTNASATGWINRAGYLGSTGQYRTLDIGDGKTNIVASFIGGAAPIVILGSPTGSGIYQTGNELDAAYGTNASSALSINLHGYLDGGSQSRDTNIYDGKTALVASFTGSTKSAVFAGPVTLNSTLTATGLSELESGLVYVDANGLSGAYSTNGSASLSVNFDGYNGGTTQKRNMVVYDGEGTQIGLWDGTNEELHVTASGGVVSDTNATTGVHRLNSASAPSGSGCTLGGGSTDNGGSVTMATASTTTCTVTFNQAWPNADVFCACSNASTGTTEALDDCEASASTLTIHATAATSAGVFSYVCTGHN